MGTSVGMHPQVGFGRQYPRCAPDACVDIYTYACACYACPGGTINIYIVTPERDQGRLLCASCEAGGERVTVLKHVGQKKRSVVHPSSNQTLMGVGMELPMSCD